MIERKILPAIMRSLSWFPVVSITGPRQVGKTTLAKWIAERLPKPTIYLDLELETDRFKLSRAEWYLNEHADKCVVIDEVQLMPELFPLLRALVDQQREPARFILLGSASPDLIREGAESLAGRISFHELTPFSLLETGADAPMEKHWIRGGFPNAYLAPDDEFSKEWMANFVQTYIERDLRRMGIDVLPAGMSRALRMLAHLHGQLLNVSDLSRSLAISVPTVNRYLDILEGSFMLHRLLPWYNNQGKRLVKSPKIYIRDSGLLNYLLNISSMEQMYGHPSIGASWEGYVIEEIKRALPSDRKLYFYRTQSGAEADLVIEHPDGKKTCIEIKFDTRPTPSKGFYQCIEDLKSESNYIIVPAGELWRYNERIEICGLSEFLNTGFF